MPQVSAQLHQGGKRLFDVLVALLAAIFVLSWLGPILALLIKLESQGPIFFKQLRTGKDGRPFYCLKFRSMHLNAHADRRQAVVHDPRVTRVGSFMRRNNLDELPQFINVLRGDMSVVGPRPHMLLHTEVYAQAIDQFMVRHSVYPGITGWAQVQGYRGATTELAAMERRVQADLWYIEKWSLALDVRIVARTLALWMRPQPNAY